MQIINKVEVGVLKEKVRLYDYLFNKFEQLPSRKSVKKAIDKGFVKVNDVVQSTGFWLSQNDVTLCLVKFSLKQVKYPINLGTNLYFSIVRVTSFEITKLPFIVFK